MALSVLKQAANPCRYKNLHRHSMGKFQNKTSNNIVSILEMTKMSDWIRDIFTFHNGEIISTFNKSNIPFLDLIKALFG